MSFAREKRCGSRISFIRPLAASFARRSVHLLDLSTGGARIEHAFPLSLGRRRILEFVCDGESLSIESEVVRSRLESSNGEAIFRTGLRFVEPDQENLWGVFAALAIDHLEPVV